MRRGFRTERNAWMRDVCKGLTAVWAGLAVLILLVPLLVVWGSGALGREALDTSDRTRNAEERGRGGAARRGRRGGQDQNAAQDQGLAGGFGQGGQGGF